MNFYPIESSVLSIAFSIDQNALKLLLFNKLTDNKLISTNRPLETDL